VIIGFLKMADDLPAAWKAVTQDGRAERTFGSVTAVAIENSPVPFLDRRQHFFERE
jgi:inorganic pyrophosphatase